MIYLYENKSQLSKGECSFIKFQKWALEVCLLRSMPHQAHQRQVEGRWKNKRIGQDAAANKRI
jgi:hypothetical protein